VCELDSALYSPRKALFKEIHDMRVTSFRRSIFLRSTSFTLLLCCAAASAPALFAQTNAGNVLSIQREFTKPGKDGSLHEKTESAFVAAAKAGKAPFHYIAMNSITGENRTLFFSAYPSYAAWEAERKATSPALAAAMDKANIPDGDLLSKTDSSLWTLAPEYSLNTKGLTPDAHFMEIIHFVLKPGHRKDWYDLMKLVIAGYKNIPSAHFTAYEMAFGNSTTGEEYILLTSMKSLSEVDTEFAADKDFVSAVGPEGLKKLGDLIAACVEGEQVNLFALNPKMSLPPDALLQSDPDFWAPKPMHMAKKPAQ
jgi:hypothetical protein